MIKAIKGTKDLLPADSPRWKYLESAVEKAFKNFNYKEIRTPVFEETSLFARGIGEETDIVGKEMYTFEDRSKTSVTLKPEMTAAVVRAYNEHSLGSQQPVTKLFYIAPMFRQERPQAGRLRQFNQFGAEAIGSSSPLLDVEMIQMSYNILTNLGLKDLAIKINSLGVPESRENYKNLLREYLKDIKDNLSEEFDSKSPVDQKILKDAPKLIDHLDEESKADYEIVKEQLEKSNIKFEVDPALVRGLDYYTKLTFEIISGSVGAQSALCGGGRYDLLIETLGGKPTPATGFAAGIERILLACENEKSFTVPDDSLDIYIIRLEKELESVVSEFAYKLRKQNLAVDFDYLQRSVKAQMREANKMNANFTLFVGGEEYEQEMITLKNMESGKEEKMLLNDMDNLVNLIKNG
jgi:histidyl-tRNA synthetase